MLPTTLLIVRIIVILLLIHSYATSLLFLSTKILTKQMIILAQAYLQYLAYPYLIQLLNCVYLINRKLPITLLTVHIIVILLPTHYYDASVNTWASKWAKPISRYKMVQIGTVRPKKNTYQNQNQNTIINKQYFYQQKLSSTKMILFVKAYFQYSQITKYFKIAEDCSQTSYRYLRRHGKLNHMNVTLNVANNLSLFQIFISPNLLQPQVIVELHQQKPLLEEWCSVVNTIRDAR
eukprot:TRINITY_DN10004_c1_g1_i4.p2 TRINITY_DN10004_c1_g1~~TRINITY_DN10004_c1_g1_i4.p2  ORF type:complete len:235 (+),score=-18.97 TRINITY_DN10004_c1_g1_i4:171-875(+)